MEELKKEVLIINGKEYNYNLNRTHVFMLSRILEKIGLKPEIEGNTDIEIGIALFNQVFSRLHYAEYESLKFIANIYLVEETEIIQLGFHNEFSLWKNIFDNEKDFFSKLFPSKEPNKLTSFIPGTEMQNQS